MTTDVSVTLSVVEGYKLDMTDNIIKICVNLSNLCHLCAIKHNAKLSFASDSCPDAIFFPMRFDISFFLP